MEARRYRAWVGRFLASASAVIAAVIVLNAVVDPFQHYRRARFYNPVFLGGNERYVNPGILRHYDYDTVLAGSSLIENFVKSHVDRTLGCSIVKVPMQAMTAGEMHRLLDVAFAAGKARRIILCLDVFSFRPPPRRDTADGMLPDYLYDGAGFNDIRYLLNASVTYESLTALVPFVQPKRRDYDKAYTYVIPPYGKAIVERWRRGDRFSIPLDDVRTDAMLGSLREHLVDVIAARPGIEFVIFFPPYSALAWYELKGRGQLPKALAFKREAARLLLEFPNVRLFDFQDEFRTITDFNHYKDSIHFSQDVSRMIIESIAAGRGRMRHDTWEASVDGLEAFVRGYRLP